MAHLIPPSLPVLAPFSWYLSHLSLLDQMPTSLYKLMCSLVTKREKSTFERTSNSQLWHLNISGNLTGSKLGKEEVKGR